MKALEMLGTFASGNGHLWVPVSKDSADFCLLLATQIKSERGVLSLPGHAIFFLKADREGSQQLA